MRAHLIQLDIQWESPNANFERVRSLISSSGVARGDLIALPELFDTGFTLNTVQSCDYEERTLEFLTVLAKETGCVVHGSRSIMPAGGDRAFNCSPVLSPISSAPLCEYYKIHPFSMGSEPQAYQGGSTITQYTWNKLAVCPLICYDLRFPELFRKASVGGAEMFVLGANWPVARQHHWRALLIARAIENQAFVLGINRCGNDPNLRYAGGSIAIGPKGDILGELCDYESILSVEIDPEQVRQWRTKFPAINDIKIRSF